MRAVVQRVREASVTISSAETAAIGRGLVVLVGVGAGDGAEDGDLLADKIVNLRVFPDDGGNMNLSVTDVGGEILVVSQFTLYGDCRKGRRPSFAQAAPPLSAQPLYAAFVARLRLSGLPVREGVFRAMMQVALVNDGPVTLLLDSRRGF
jgi:D-tyrosyl-tRNA(Tyr) deacylase